MRRTDPPPPPRERVTDHNRPAGPPPPDDASAGARAPTHAERCRTLVLSARSATLCTIARDPAGYPYGSLVSLAIDDLGRPLFLLSSLAEHTENLKARADASVLVTEPLGAHAEPLALGRVTILGTCMAVPAGERERVKAIFLAQQPRAASYVDFRDFAFYRLEPAALRYVGGFGRMSWVTASAYRAAEPDPLREAAPGILAHMNEDHADANLAYARSLLSIADAASATMTAVDRYGFELAITTSAGPRAGRIAFDDEVTTSDEARKALIALVKRARAGG